MCGRAKCARRAWLGWRAEYRKNSKHYISFVSNPQEALEELEELKKIVPGEALVYFLLSKVGLCSASLNDIQNQLKTKASFHWNVLKVTVFAVLRAKSFFFSTNERRKQYTVEIEQFLWRRRSLNSGPVWFFKEANWFLSTRLLYMPSKTVYVSNRSERTWKLFSFEATVVHFYKKEFTSFWQSVVER